MPEMGTIDTIVHEARVRRRSSQSAVADRLPTIEVPSRRISDGGYRRLAFGLLVSDALTVGVGVTIASGVVATPARSTAAAAALWLCWMITLSATGSRRPDIIGVGLSPYKRIMSAMTLTYASVAVALLYVDVHLALSSFAAAIPVVAVLVLAERVVWGYAVRSLRRSGRCLAAGIVVGLEEEVVWAVRELRNSPGAGLRPVAIALVGQLSATPPRDVADLPQIALDEVECAVRATSSRAVVIAGDLPSVLVALRPADRPLGDLRAEMLLASRSTGAPSRIHLRRVRALQTVYVDRPQREGRSALMRALGLVTTA